MTDQTVQTLLWCLAAICAIHGAVVYSIVRLLVTGRAIFERRNGAPQLVYERDREHR